MKKMLSVIIGMASVLFLHSGNVYAEMGEVYDMRLYGWYVTESDIYDLNKEYRENKDFDKANEMMEKSLIAMDIATKARMSAGVHFKADEAYE